MKLYIESSIINFVFADDAPERQKITKEFFASKLMNFEVFVSDIVIDELGETKEPKKSALFELIKKYPLTNLKNSQEAINLARSYIEAGIIPEKFLNIGIPH